MRSIGKCRRRMGAALAALALALGGTATQAAEGAGDSLGGELRLHWDGRSTSTAGPLAAANTLVPGLAPPAANTWIAEAELRHTLRGKLGTTPVSLAGNLLAWHQRPEGQAAHSDARVNELYGSADLGAWQLSAGKKVIGWDVGYGFRPNDVVQQETRRTLLATTPEGRPLLQLERFGAEDALSLVWVNPERLNHGDDSTRGPRESALALRGYQRFGALDAFGFARVGAHTGASLGTALAWVATDELELHASLRVLQRHDGWQIGPAGTRAVPANPWQQATLGGTSQWLVGANWTGQLQQSLMLEYWHDGTAMSDAEWDRWSLRNAALPGTPGPAIRAAGNLAWQASPFNSASLRRDNLFLRLAWQPEHWQLAIDLLLNPADRGRLLTTSAQWQGDQWRLNAAWRVATGPDSALVMQLPTRRSVLLAATRSF
jgi:hypothetical protein